MVVVTQAPVDVARGEAAGRRAGRAGPALEAFGDALGKPQGEVIAQLAERTTA
jgi:hypothetical protein